MSTQETGAACVHDERSLMASAALEAGSVTSRAVLQRRGHARDRSSYACSTNAVSMRRRSTNDRAQNIRQS